MYIGEAHFVRMNALRLALIADSEAISRILVLCTPIGNRAYFVDMGSPSISSHAAHRLAGEAPYVVFALAWSSRCEYCSHRARDARSRSGTHTASHPRFPGQQRDRLSGGRIGFATCTGRSTVRILHTKGCVGPCCPLPSATATRGV